MGEAERVENENIHMRCMRAQHCMQECSEAVVAVWGTASQY